MTQKAVVSKSGITKVDLSDEEKQEIANTEQQWQNEKPDRLKNSIRSNRRFLLEEADHKINTLVDNNQDASAWRTYRQQLRDMTAQSDLANPIYPTKPS